MRISGRTVAPALITATLVALTVAPAWAAPAAPAVPSDAAAAAGWAGRQLKDGDHVEGDFGADPGLTADVVLALSATRTGRAETAAATDWLAAHADSYLTGDTPGDIYAGSLAKLALVAEAGHRDPGAFAGRDLIAQLNSRMQPSGRFTDHATFGGPEVNDYSNTLTQSLALIALKRDGDSVPALGVDFLLANQCADGGFPVFFPDAGAECASDADGTGMVVQALLAAGHEEDAAGKALDWLESKQGTDGGFAGTGPTAVVNANSTALATQALRAGGRGAAADKGADWLRARQVGCAGAAADRGAVGYQEAAVDGSALRATVQAVTALSGISYATVDGAGATDGLATVDCSSPSPTGSGSATASPSPTGEPTEPGGSASPTDSATPSASDSAPVTPSATAPAPGGSAAAGGTGGTGGALASTGTSVLAPAAGSAALVAAGAAVVLAARRRRSAGTGA
ncbi:prenyltransferase/squalene oxidase repeat-containing protein [Streptomyces sp. NPDC046977]|uniref:prenyltransferase/squalene oxidase repeat-containing protein n=1 Tax=Streptomyces sp. NPDC046977 TaxID=3154703 RepID=UPI0033CF96D6